MRVTVEQAADKFIELAIEQGIDPDSLDRAAIERNFAEVFARKTAEQHEASS
ncbi:hypothetical protein CVS54_01375 [Microbacterium oxydans]|uniref:Uncharacterized protein n=1 Tax=Microbacterium oxydans TaxID=82380 RepID=A0A3Q9J325_9MICO|nr:MULTISPECIES: hypothetical protein [Microbacterium]AZS40053.1 hypothetical protein CVS54_01375 [Microbacterium oxydans]